MEIKKFKSLFVCMSKFFDSFGVRSIYVSLGVHQYSNSFTFFDFYYTFRIFVNFFFPYNVDLFLQSLIPI